MNGQPMTAREAYIEASSFLRLRQVPDAAICVELLLQHLMQWDRSTMLMRFEEPFPQAKMSEWLLLVERKAAGEPVQYIIGEQEFYGLPFQVNAAVLIPRPETELLVEQVVKRGNELWPGGAPKLVDIGSGSGAIPITIAVQCPLWQISSSDISLAALEVARANAELNGVAAKINFSQSDLLDVYIQEQQQIDILVSNPPYIASGDIEELQREVKSFEPRLALDGGADGLILYRRMCEQLMQLPAFPRLVAFEVGQGQTEAVSQMLADLQNWEQIEVIVDYAGIARHVIAVKKL
ncbi:peptide chain release factor N(5)-glutamine methyltransferase [Paenibacillus psychroresistens]|uniref:Release factor glutamine methyltransferase n=1 Tax=Paenibacillus psychroresistens TaxID=1778678 RepID=A0A6B8R8U3_9BACL|nr:peptide chain release factor N(5)-glutamine methyltransferase [Paenibacillus psychroresistens]QGQ93461.1 peptide chain release factor N(5)-glutamine methyltransferase [Paenibacillus psychroresistens]